MANKAASLSTPGSSTDKLAGLLLIACTVCSLLITASSAGAGYIALIHKPIDLSLGPLALNYSLEHWVNEGLMAIFFLMVGLEVKYEIKLGELSSFKKALLPIAAAMGGICVPALLHFSLNHGLPSQPGFAIPMATDIAFALGILALAGNKVPV